MTRTWDSSFPFLWGTATSSHQVEGQNTRNDWWAWEQAGKVSEASGRACDHFHQFSQDFNLIAQLEQNAHRFSIEWSRIEPEPNRWDEGAIEHYRRILQELRARHIEPVVTLHHFTNPTWFANQGGWKNPESISIFVRYVRKVVEALSSYAKIWITINEPLVYVYHSFSIGTWPPGETSFESSKQVIRHMVHAHVEAYRAIHQIYDRAGHGDAKVSFAKHMTYLKPCRRTSWADRWSVFLRDAFFNLLFIRSVQSGFLFFPGMYCEPLSTHHAMDFIGLNYYARDFIRFAGFKNKDFLGVACEKEHHRHEITERNFLGWDIYPNGLYWLLMRLERFNLPVLITENGICTGDDEQRCRFIRNHLRAVSRARMEGVNVQGYFHWSLLDNFEWDKGFKPRFGLVDINYETQERRVRKSAQVLTETCRKLVDWEGNYAKRPI